MAEDLLRYDILVESALRDVVRQAMAKVAQEGLPGEHHFYISFMTKYPGVVIPEYLDKQYPDEMTIVLQYQFYGLKIEENGFSVMLSFNNVREKLEIPFQAITTFADPSVNFALQFQPAMTESDDDDMAPAEGGPDGETSSEKPAPKGEVISLDQFRKK